MPKSSQTSLSRQTSFLAACRKAAAALSLAVVAAGAGLNARAQAFNVTNLVSDGSVPAVTTDPNFINPWGISVSPNWWISAAGSGYNYVVPTAGTISFKVIVPQGAQITSNGFPAGSVTAAGSTGMLLPNGTAPSFMFSTLDGTISGWNGKLGTANALSQIVINNTAAGASYPGLALLNTTSAGSFLLAPNFNSGKIEIYNSAFKTATLAGTFTDPNLPANYAPYSIHILGTQIYVAYAQRTATAPFNTVVAPGAGVLDVFDTTGVFVARAITGGNLNAPWGVAIAPASFGIYSNDLLVGNFGDGKINVYDPKTYSYIGQLMDSTGKSLAYASLWDLVTGGTKVTGTTSVSAGDTSTVYFSAGLAKEAHGLLGGIANTATAGSTPTFALTTSSSSATIAAGTGATTSVSIAPVNGFSGPVTLSCSGLPAGVTCFFGTGIMTVSSTAASVGTVTINTTSATGTHALLQRGHLQALAAVCLLPFASLLGFRRRLGTHLPTAWKVLGLLLALAGSTVLVTGCGDSGGTPFTATPVGQASVTIVATAGATTQQSTFSLTVQ